MEKFEGMEYGEDHQARVLEWAASMEDIKPSPRLEFIKKMIGLLTQDELGRLKKMVMHTRRNERKRKLREEKKPPVTPAAASSSFDAVNPVGVSGGTKEAPKKLTTAWWDSYRAEDIVAWDSEHVTKSNGTYHYQEAATVDIVDMNGNPVYSTKIRHATRSFHVNDATYLLTGFKENDFDNASYPDLETAAKQVAEVLKDKLVITLGGAGDYAALGLAMENFDHFDLQRHWWMHVVNEHGVTVPQFHSLRSLCRHYGIEDPQEQRHTSIADAQATMELFKIYQKIKMGDDPENLHDRVNRTRSYNEINVYQCPIKAKLKEMKKSKKKKTGARNVQFYFD